MAAVSVRRNEQLLTGLRAVLVGLVTYAGLAGMRFEPGWGALALGFAAGLVTLASADVGVFIAILALAVPLSAANPVVGILFVVLGAIATHYLGTDGAGGYLLIAGAFVGAFYGPAWMIIPLAGYVLGAGEGALAAALACLCLELAGIGLGAGAIAGSVTLHGGSKALVSFADAPESLFSAQWVVDAVDAIGGKAVDRVGEAFTSVRYPWALAVQPAVWALGAGLAGKMLEPTRSRKKPLTLAAAVGVGIAVPAAGSLVIHAASSVTPPVGAVAFATITSFLVAGAAILVLDRGFSWESVATPAKPPRPSTMSMEDADVDELLRLVATAEDRLASQHTTTKVVMITDMKSFSKMTEEDGSILSAKTIQKHRDLLLPIIESAGGHGKSTGGDGLVAAFDDARSAIHAAVEMMRALDAHNSSHPSERELAIRLGIAEGEVVLDKGGRPFIGTALNLAARIMNLADGEQALCTAELAAKAQGVVPFYSHGEFQLKNIAQPVSVVELIWSPDHPPRAPLVTASTAED